MSGDIQLSLIGAYLCNTHNKDASAKIFSFVDDLEIAETCKAFQIITHVAMTHSWKTCLDRLDSKLSLNEFIDFEESYEGQDKKIKSRLKERMLTLYPPDPTATSKIGIPSADAVTGCFQRLIDTQREVIYGSGCKAQIDAFKALQQRWSTSLSSTRFIEIEKIIDDVQSEKDRCLEVVWNAMLTQSQLQAQDFPTAAAEIRGWLNNPRNKEQLVESIQINELNLNNANLSCFPPEICTLLKDTNIDILYLSRNRLFDLPLEFALLSGKLKKLYLETNCFDKVPEVIGGLAQLEKLDLLNNPITELPSFLEIPSLNRILVSFNSLTRISSGLFYKVHFLGESRHYCPTNRLNNLEEMFEELPFEIWFDRNVLLPSTNPTECDVGMACLDLIITVFNSFLIFLRPIAAFVRSCLGYGDTVRITHPNENHLQQEI